MRRGWEVAVVLAGCLMAAPLVRAQAPADNERRERKTSKADKNAKKGAQTPGQPAG